VELARSLDAAPAEQRSVLAALRLRRRLTVEEAAKRAALWPDQVEWLEEGRLSRFPTSEAAALALIRYATSLGIDHREARRLSGLPVEPLRRTQLARWAAAASAIALVAVLLTALFLAFARNSAQPGGSKAAALPAPWRVTVDVLNGGGDINFTRRLASRVGSFGYHLGHVTRATRFDYRQTIVYFEPGGEALAQRLSSQLGCGTTSPLPGGPNQHRLVVITGPPSAAC
jgi:transcriptional regulator with XRE-family HTH domain